MIALRSGRLYRVYRALRLSHILALALPLCLASGTAQSEATVKSVTLFAAASTANAVSEIVEQFNQRSGNKARAVFAASSTLAKQIANGAPADLFLSANQRWMDYLIDKSAVKESSVAPLLSNRLVLIVNARYSIADEAVPEVVGTETPLAKILGDSRLAIGDPAHVPAGIYAKAALESAGLWSAVASRLAYSGNVRAALALVERGEAAAGIVYETDARLVSNIKRAGVFSKSSHPPIVYSLAITSDEEDSAVKAFHDFLRGPKSQEIFSRHGFNELATAE